MTNRRSNPDLLNNDSSSKQNSRANSQDENGGSGSGGVDSDGRNQQATPSSSSIPVSKWTVEKTLEWFSKKFPVQYELFKDAFVQNNVNGEVLLDFNYNCLDHLNIFDYHFREQLMEEISLLKIRNDYEFIKRFRSQNST